MAFRLRGWPVRAAGFQGTDIVVPTATRGARQRSRWLLPRRDAVSASVSASPVRPLLVQGFEGAEPYMEAEKPVRRPLRGSGQHFGVK